MNPSNDKFWQNMVKRLMVETKNIKQLRIIQEKDTLEVIKENEELKDKLKRLALKYDELVIINF